MGHRSITWTPEMLDALRVGRERGLPLFVLAERIGVAYPTCVYKARELGLARRLNRGPISGAEAVRKPVARTA